MFINDLMCERNLIRHIQKHHIHKLYAPDNPSGILLFQKQGKYLRWFKRDLQNGKPVMEMLSKKDTKLAEALALNLYRLICIQCLQEKLDLLDIIIRNYERKENKVIRKDTREELGQGHFLTELPLQVLLNKLKNYPREPADFFRLESPYRAFIVAHLQKEYAEVINWYLGGFIKNTDRPEHLLYPVKLKYNVRSKSEVLAADRLFEEGILFHYEEQVVCSNSVVFPDFLIYITSNERHGWEHFGSMDGENYYNRTRGKILTYLDGGWFPGINMITTYETRSNPLTEEQVDQKVRWLKNRCRLAFPDMPPDESFNMYDLAEYVRIQRGKDI